MVGPIFYQVKLGFEPLMITYRVVEVTFSWLVKMSSSGFDFQPVYRNLIYLSLVKGGVFYFPPSLVRVGG